MSKRPKGVQRTASGSFLEGIKVYIPNGGIPFLQSKAKLWLERVPSNGGAVTQDASEASITHVLTGDKGIAAIPAQLQPPLQPQQDVEPANGAATGWEVSQGKAQPLLGSSEVGSKRRLPDSHSQRQHSGVSPHCVHYTWLERCLSERRLVDEVDYPPTVPAAPNKAGQESEELRQSASITGGPATTADLEGHKELDDNVKGGDGEESVSLQQRRRWLGVELWHPGCASMSLTELVLQAVFSEERCKRVGNEDIAQVFKYDPCLQAQEALTELAKYERALQDDYAKEEPGGDLVGNYRPLRYSRAAAVVRGCSYKLEGEVQPGQLPFVGQAIARQINEILATGTCAALEDFRWDRPVRDSKGQLRPGTAGGRTRLMFRSLPLAGRSASKKWWDLGLRSFEDVLAAAQPGGTLSLTAAQRFSIEHREDLRGDTTAEEVEEMRAHVAAVIEAVSYPGWRIEVVGGQARGEAHHDADLLVTHPSRSREGVVDLLKERLIQQGRLMPPHQAMCQVQSGLLRNHIQRMKQEHLLERGIHTMRQMMDRFDHIYGIYRTKAGKMRRLDVIVVPPSEWAFALVGWIGPRQYNRFLRLHALDLGMALSSHGLLRKVGSQVYLVPSERPPLNRQGQEWWPPGWGPGRAVETQRDVFELLGLPYREPWERDCP